MTRAGKERSPYVTTRRVRLPSKNEFGTRRWLELWPTPADGTDVSGHSEEPRQRSDIGQVEVRTNVLG